ncbi:sigma-54 dependent transcriptional regulator [Burkholderia ubonensis]|uniref:sigma-54 dependent transcriptional regulator n=1 Tax=Burkholderia ubonensis TaxID=101571 RepID=UPI001E2EA926|nr:sigma-54 dependent transcriptional regulator [Burkholderia ubonensis]
MRRSRSVSRPTRRTSSSACASRIRSEARHHSEVIVHDSCSVSSILAPGSAPRLTIAHSDEAGTAQLPAVRPLVYLSPCPDAALVAHLLERRWDVLRARSAHEAQRLVKPEIAHAGIVDLDGFTSRDIATLEPILRHQQIGWIALADSTRLAEPDIRKLIRQCCFDYVKDAPTLTTIGYLVGHAYGMMTLCDLDRATDVAATGDDEMVGTCDVMQKLFRTIRKVANTDAAVFISGESGTGKELTALAIHERSSRRKAPFVAINCGAIPHHLLQSELFGYERGAFTGANQRKIGRIESAHGGTLFLDEIGDMPLESQASMLRFLQERRIERLGGRESIPVDVRILSATHVDLEKAIADGRFREDLFYRLCVLRIDEPPLRARGKDIELLAHHVLLKFRSDSARKIRGFTPCAIEAMYSYPWPGNVRELINRIRRAVVMAESYLISARDLGLGPPDGQAPMTLAEVREHAARRAIEAALLRRRNMLSEAAKDLGISRTTLYRLMCLHGLHGGGDPTTNDAPQQE